MDGLRGWGRGPNMSKYHMFNTSNMSLCGRWSCLLWHDDMFEDDDGNVSPEDCKTCRKKLEALTGV